MKIAVVAPVMKSGEKGGAEALYTGLVRGLRQTSHDVDRIDVVIDESSFDAILESYEKCSNLDLHDYDMVISTKAPTYAVRHRNHVSYLLHTIRVFYDMFHHEFGKGNPEQFRQRRWIHALDKKSLHPDHVRKHFVIGHIPFRRLYEVDVFWHQIKFDVLHPPPALRGFRAPRAGEYVLLPGRLHSWKRVDLIVKAFQYVKKDMPLKVAGTGEAEPGIRALAAGDRRIEFLGRVSDEQLLDLYAGALVIPFVPVNEDYGLITIEAFRSKKPVITCLDSGEPTYFVKDNETGFVVRPEPEAIARKINYLIDHPDHGAEMGEKGFSTVAHITWDDVVAKLLSSIELPQKRVHRWMTPPTVKRPLKAVITDNQCVEPAVGGARLRLLGLYSTLTEGIEATYVGTYDCPGAPYRELQLSKRLREIDVPQSNEHFALNDHLNALLPGQTIIDVTIPWLVWSSEELVNAVRKYTAEAEVVIFSHPWMYGCLRDVVRGGKLIIYDAHNCEAPLREQLLASNEFGRCLAQCVRWIEGQLCQECDLILACSEEDRQTFVELYGIKPQKIVIVPNGVDIRAIHPAPGTVRARAREKLSVAGFVALFIGSTYPPNIEAVRVILDQLAPANPDVTFVIVGGAGDRAMSAGYASNPPSNVRLLGAVSDEVRNEAYAAADIAVNPMFTGFGTNIKMLDFLAAGLPTLTTPVGARGIINRHKECFVVDDISRFNDWIRTLRQDPQLRARLAANGRKLAEDLYDWRQISERLGKLILEHSRTKRSYANSPYFSVIIPSYERPQSLAKLLNLLGRQVFSDFEVIVVDQSATLYELTDLQCNFAIQYIHTNEKGAVKARNLGIKHARGQVIAFTDDDCEPAAQWLANAYKYFDDPQVVGIEGFIESDEHDEEQYRIVRNLGVKSLGFKTANLFLRKNIVDKIEGFDERFDNPHFREDTDLAWRALTEGEIPFADDVRVLHPAHPRDIQRESGEERAKFFVHDPLLFHKHPERYIQLLKAEKHYAQTPGFWEHFMRGMVRYKVEIPIEDLRQFTTADQYALMGELAKQLCSGPVDDSHPAESSISMRANQLILAESAAKIASMRHSPT